MTGKPAKVQKHVPQRTCVGCRTTLAKRSLIRVVRRPEGVIMDPSGKAAGRGAYVHNRRSCWEKALKGALANALKITLTPDDEKRLRDFTQTLIEEGDQSDEMQG